MFLHLDGVTEYSGITDGELIVMSLVDKINLLWQNGPEL